MVDKIDATQEARTLTNLIECGHLDSAQKELNDLPHDQAIKIAQLIKQDFDGDALKKNGFPLLTIDVQSNQVNMHTAAAEATSPPLAANSAPADSSAPAGSTAGPGVATSTSPEATASASPDAAPGANKISLASSYVDYNSATGPTVDANLKYNNATLNIASGADASAGLHIAGNTSIMQATIQEGKWTEGVIPTSMGVENNGTNAFNTYSDVYDNERTAALGVNYSPSDKFSVGITNDGTTGSGLAPNALEFSYSTPVNSHLKLYAGADLGLNQSILNTNLTYSNKKLSVAADILHNNSGTVASLEGTYQLGNNVSASARLQSSGKEALALTDQISKNSFVQLQQENRQTSIEVGLHI